MVSPTPPRWWPSPSIQLIGFIMILTLVHAQPSLHSDCELMWQIASHPSNNGSSVAFRGWRHDDTCCDGDWNGIICNDEPRIYSLSLASFGDWLPDLSSTTIVIIDISYSSLPSLPWMPFTVTDILLHRLPHVPNLEVFVNHSSVKLLNLTSMAALTLPSWIGSLGMTELYLTDLPSQHALPSTMYNLTNLLELSVSKCCDHTDFSFMPSLSSLVSLTISDVASIIFTDSSFLSLTELQSIVIRSCAFHTSTFNVYASTSGQWDKRLAALSLLTMIITESSLISVPENVLNIPSLRELRLSNNSIDGRLVIPGNAWPALMDISHNEMDQLELFGRDVSWMQWLDVSHNNISEVMLAKQEHPLLSLNLGHNLLDGSLMHLLDRAPIAIWLSFRDNALRAPSARDTIINGTATSECTLQNGYVANEVDICVPNGFVLDNIEPDLRHYCFIPTIDPSNWWWTRTFPSSALIDMNWNAYFDSDNCLCRSGFFGSKTKCEPCPSFSFCPGGLNQTLIIPQAGRWMDNTTGSPVSVACRHIDAREVCSPNYAASTGDWLNTISPCAQGYDAGSRMCSSCQRDYYMISGECHQCGHETWGGGLQIAGITIVVGALITYALLLDNDSSGALKVLVFYANMSQILPYLGYAGLHHFSDDGDNTAGRVESFQSILFFRLQLTGPECYDHRWDFISWFWLYAAFPLIWFGVILVCFLIGLCCRRYRCACCARASNDLNNPHLVMMRAVVPLLDDDRGVHDADAISIQSQASVVDNDNNEVPLT
jgi:hypothetical protein